MLLKGWVSGKLLGGPGAGRVTVQERLVLSWENGEAREHTQQLRGNGNRWKQIDVPGTLSARSWEAGERVRAGPEASQGCPRSPGGHLDFMEPLKGSFKIISKV